MKYRTVLAAAGLLSTALVLAGCSTQGMDMGSSSSDTSSSSSASSASSHNDSDVAFATQMIPHHQQAVEMADIVLAKSGVDSRVVDLAKQIKAAQDPEIVTMTTWLKTWGQRSPAAMDGMAMNGLMSQADMDALKNASGPDSSKLFLQQMTQHHQGAIDMANEELSSGRDAAALTLAKKIVVAQTAEIVKMKGLLASM
ncbi:MAG: DUF305 domain-containing protein [Acidobacteria bacterium]|nr:DUF305 domain-containing protein [Acidobacteriota bacterium]